MESQPMAYNRLQHAASPEARSRLSSPLLTLLLLTVWDERLCRVIVNHEQVNMAGQSLRRAGFGEKVPSYGKRASKAYKGLPILVAPVPRLEHRQGQPQAVCTAISGIAATKSAVSKQQSDRVCQEEEASFSAEALNQSSAASEDNVICTFRWPAALPGQDVSVVGECTS